jgi:hypothetical protein
MVSWSDQSKAELNHSKPRMNTVFSRPKLPNRRHTTGKLLPPVSVSQLGIAGQHFSAPLGEIKMAGRSFRPDTGAM